MFMTVRLAARSNFFLGIGAVIYIVSLWSHFCTRKKTCEDTCRRFGCCTRLFEGNFPLELNAKQSFTSAIHVSGKLLDVGRLSSQSFWLDKSNTKITNCH